MEAWLTVYDRKIFLNAKVEGIQAAGAEPNSPELTDTVTERKTADIDEHRAYTSLMNDWIQDNDTDGTLIAKRDTAVQHLDPLLEERNRLIEEVIRTYNALRNAATNSSDAADSTYDALKVAHQQAKDDRLANDALIRGIFESHRAEPDNFKDIRRAATTPPTRAATQAGNFDPPSPPSPPGFTTPPVTPRDTIFSGVKIASAYLYYLQEHHALKWPCLQRRPSQPYGAHFRQRPTRRYNSTSFTVWRSQSLCHTRRARRLLRGDGGTPARTTPCACRWHTVIPRARALSHHARPSRPDRRHTTLS